LSDGLASILASLVQKAKKIVADIQEAKAKVKKQLAAAMALKESKTSDWRHIVDDRENYYYFPELVGNPDPQHRELPELTKAMKNYPLTMMRAVETASCVLSHESGCSFFINNVFLKVRNDMNKPICGLVFVLDNLEQMYDLDVVKYTLGHAEIVDPLMKEDPKIRNRRIGKMNREYEKRYDLGKGSRDGDSELPFSHRFTRSQYDKYLKRKLEALGNSEGKEQYVEYYEPVACFNFSPDAYHEVSVKCDLTRGGKFVLVQLNTFCY
jgi:hypothetical protein